MAISRMQEPRQLYGLGSLVKSIGKTVKKVVKSDLGKAALLAAVGFGIPGTSIGGLLGRASFGGAAPGVFGLGGIGNALGAAKGTLFGQAGSRVGEAFVPYKKGLLSSTAGKLGVGAALSALAASGMDQEEIAEIENDPEKLRIYLKDYYSKTNPDASGAEIEEFVRINSAVGGRVGLENGTPKKGLESISIKDVPLIKGPYMIKYDKDGNPVKYPKPKGEPYRIQYDEEGNPKKLPERLLLRNKSAMGGRIGFSDAGIVPGTNNKLRYSKSLMKEYKANVDEGYEGSVDDYIIEFYGEEYLDPTFAKGGRVGLMGGAMPTGVMRANKAGTIERDYRETGGFVPVGIKEKADDVPAMLSKNEFVMTADAVRGIGDGNIEKGAQRLYDQMKTAEKRVV